MKNKLNLVIAITALTAVFFLNSCKKEEITSVADSKKQAETFTKATNATVQDVSNLVNMQNMAIGVLRHINGSFKTSGDFGPCAVVTQDTLSFPRSVLIDMGAGCEDPSTGDMQSGSIFIEYTSPELDALPGNYIRLTFTDFVGQESDTTNGIVLFTYNGLNGNGNRVVHASTNLTTGTMLDEIRYTGINEFDIEAIQDTTGGNSFYNLSITGSGSGVANGLTFTQTVTTPLIWTLDQCEFFVSGILEIQNQGQPDKQVNFGTGACDNQAVVREPGNTYTIQLLN